MHTYNCRSSYISASLAFGNNQSAAKNIRKNVFYTQCLLNNKCIRILRQNAVKQKKIIDKSTNSQKKKSLKIELPDFRDLAPVKIHRKITRVSFPRERKTWPLLSLSFHNNPEKPLSILRQLASTSPTRTAASYRYRERHKEALGKPSIGKSPPKLRTAVETTNQRVAFKFRTARASRSAIGPLSPLFQSADWCACVAVGLYLYIYMYILYTIPIL